MYTYFNDSTRFNENNLYKNTHIPIEHFQTHLGGKNLQKSQ